MASPQSSEDRAPIHKPAATRLPELAGWVGEIAELTKPDAVVWCDGSQAEWDRLTSLLVENGTMTRLNPQLRPNSFWCASDPRSDARKITKASGIIPGDWGKVGPGWLAQPLLKTCRKAGRRRQNSPVPLAAFARCQ